jgi:hypothetical protein
MTYPNNIHILYFDYLNSNLKLFCECWIFFFVNNNVVFEVDLKLVITLAQIKVDISEFDCRLMLSINQDTIEKYKSHVLRK